MRNIETKDGNKEPATDKGSISAPAISLPKGGGAIRGIGEKFASNPITGTGSMTVPIATSPGRSGFGPQLSLSYDSGAGNGPFGFGWSLSLPSITRKTDKGLPRYWDAEESDVFILSGAEDLVPVLEANGKPFKDNTSVPGYTIYRYRPRIEGLFARIERWTASDGDVHWRSISKDNILTLYGKDANSRIADPGDPTRIFSWLICETRDDKGNAILYEYKPEDGVGVDLTRAHERNRGDHNDPRRATNRYLKRIRYGNRVPLLDNAGHRPRVLTVAQFQNAGWMFEVVFDYEDHDLAIPRPRDDEEKDAAGMLKRPWSYRRDPFSTYRAGFEVRTIRLCQRVLMFHHFAGEPGVGVDCLVRSTDFTYSYEKNLTDARNPIYSFLLSVSQSGYKRNNGGYQKSSLPPVEFEYTQPIVKDTVEEVDPKSLENLPVGLDGATYQWTDLHGEGIPGILTEQAGAWFYKRNLSPINLKPGPGVPHTEAKFAPVELVAVKPNLGIVSGAQFMDLAGDGQPDLVVMDGPMPGLYEHDEAEGWQPFRPFTSRLSRDMHDPNLKFVDLDGDGHADVLITEDDAFVWHPSLAEEGFAPARRVAQALDEEKGPRLVFADGTQSIYLADLSGDGLTDLVRIRNGEVCYWPNLGYGRFGARVTMDNAPHFDNPDQFDQKRLRLADIDGTGTTDIIYLHRDGVRLYFNQSGNSWSAPQMLRVFPRVDDVVSIVPTDLLGNGTACLVWSSPLPGDARRQMRYVDLMGGQKPHLLITTKNNLGAETHVQYVSSTKFYLQDKRDGRPWVTRLPFPVHVVERVETYDHISRNRFVTRYAYHHGYFDGEEREFRGFGMVEQWDTEEFAALSTSDTFPVGDNIDAASHVPPVHTKTWFHTGIYLGRDHVSDFFAGLLDVQDGGEYYREPGLTDAQVRALLLSDTVLPAGLTPEEEREACRALKGSMLRQEVYAMDGTVKESHPYSVTEQNFTIRRLQLRAENRHAVFLTHARESISYHYERNPADPRIGHALTLEVDEFGKVLKSAATGYGRRQPDMSLSAEDQAKQTQILITYTENRVTNAIDSANDHRTPLPCESRTYELTGLTLPAGSDRLTFEEILDVGTTAIPLDYEKDPTVGRIEKRLIEHVRTLYRKNDLTDFSPLGTVGSLALPGESYKLAFTPNLLKTIFIDTGKLSLNDVNNVFGTDGGYVHSEGDANWWIPSGRVFLSPNSNDTAAQELTHARQHFFLLHRYRDPFGQTSVVIYDGYDLLMVETRDALGNRVTVGERLPNGNIDPNKPGNDYRVLQPWRVMDPNRNRTQVAFDALGMVVGTAVMGKPEENLGDSLEGFEPDLPEQKVQDHIGFPLGRQNPPIDPNEILKKATTRLVYDLFAYQRTHADPNPQPAVVYTLARKTHNADLETGQQTKIQHSFSYSDGFGREIQKKIQAEPKTPGGLPRWVGSGWTIFNNKGKPVRQYEPFFTASHRFEFARIFGISPILFYDPVERVVATLHPNHTWEKVVFDPWHQKTYDVNDTVKFNPRADTDISGYVEEYFKQVAPQPDDWKTWYEQRINGGLGAEEQIAAQKTELHADTPTVAHFDSLGRTFLTIADNGSAGKYETRLELDIEGNQREVIDAKDRIVMRYDYDMLGNRIHQLSMEAGARWMLNDVTGKPLYAWDSRNHEFSHKYDPLRRPTEMRVSGGDAPIPLDNVYEKIIYGEGQSLNGKTDQELNLRGKPFAHYDTAGKVQFEEYDFKGNLLRSTRRLLQKYKEQVNWAQTPAPDLENETFVSCTVYDALNRPIQLVVPHVATGANIKTDVIQPYFNEANLLEKIDVWMKHNGEPADLLATNTANLHAVKDIDYNAKGQRTKIDYGNNVKTTYTYDPDTFRLARLLTIRTGFNEDEDQSAQDLRYTYDPAGNITYIYDHADIQNIIYFSNQRVEPSADYVYDAIYRLSKATGREHLGQAAQPWPNWNDEFRVKLAHPHDGQQMRRYTEEYEYDQVGNFMKMVHHATNGNWTRTYDYVEDSLIETNVKSNRLSSSEVGRDPSGPKYPEPYGYNAHGSIIRMPHFTNHADPNQPNMYWDYKDQLCQTDLGGGGTAYYVYDASGQRVRKVVEKNGGSLIEERIYLGSFEIYRKNGASPLERETLHIMDDKQRIALVETRTLPIRSDPNDPIQLIRYQFGNHLGSASLELDDQAQIISYEEYYPFGATAFLMMLAVIRARGKRYRYTGKERDEESGLYYHGARYYAPWLGRWVSADPAGLVDGPNLYLYTLCNPVRFYDRTGRQSIEERIEKIESPIGWFFAKTGYDIWNVASLGTLSKVETQKNLGTWQGVGESTFTAVRNVSNTASFGLQERIYETQMREGPGLTSIGKGVLKAGEDILPIEEADILANPEATAEEKWRAGGMALSKAANLFALGLSVTGKNVTVPREKGMGTHAKSLSIEEVQARWQKQATKGQLRKTKPPENIKQRRIYEKKHGKLDPAYQPDHVVDMQLGGPPKDVSNLAPLDKAPNLIAGPRVQGQIRTHRLGQRYDRVLIEGQRVPVNDVAGIFLVNQAANIPKGREVDQTTIHIPDIDMDVTIYHPKSTVH